MIIQLAGGPSDVTYKYWFVNVPGLYSTNIVAVLCIKQECMYQCAVLALYYLHVDDYCLLRFTRVMYRTCYGIYELPKCFTPSPPILTMIGSGCMPAWLSLQTKLARQLTLTLAQIGLYHLVHPIVLQIAHLLVSELQRYGSLSMRIKKKLEFRSKIPWVT